MGLISVLGSFLQEGIMTEYLNSKNLTEAVISVRDMKAPKHFLPEMLSKIVFFSLDRSDEDKEHVSTLIHTLRTEGLISGENFMQVHDDTPSMVTRTCSLLMTRKGF